MASVLKKFFKFCNRHHSGEAAGVRKPKHQSTQSPTRPSHRRLSMMRMFKTRDSSKRDAHKVSPEEGFAANKDIVEESSDPLDSTSATAASASPDVKSRNSSSSGGVFSLSKVPKVSKSWKAEPSSAKHTRNIRARRLMKEFQEITKYSRNMENPPFVVELVDDNLHEWNIKLYQIDPESEFYSDMKEAEIDHIFLNIVFPDNFPFSPPFMRVISPHVDKGFVMEGGAICMELLTPKGWASAYTVEAVLIQFAASLVKGQGRILRKCKNGREFNKKSAEASFRSLVKTHDKYGWVTPPLADG